jgi:hypothetical protein
MLDSALLSGEFLGCKLPSELRFSLYFNKELTSSVRHYTKYTDRDVRQATAHAQRDRSGFWVITEGNSTGSPKLSKEINHSLCTAASHPSPLRGRNDKIKLVSFEERIVCDIVFMMLI